MAYFDIVAKALGAKAAAVSGDTIALDSERVFGKAYIDIKHTDTPTLTCVVDASIDGTNWFALENVNGDAVSSASTGSDLVAGFSVDLEGLSHIRLRVSAWTAGTVTVDLKANRLP